MQAEATDLPRAAAQPEDELEDIIERSEELATVRRGRSDDADPVRGDTVEG